MERGTPVKQMPYTEEALLGLRLHDTRRLRWGYIKKLKPWQNDEGFTVQWDSGEESTHWHFSTGWMEVYVEDRVWVAPKSETK